MYPSGTPEKRRKEFISLKNVVKVIFDNMKLHFMKVKYNAAGAVI